ncbi:MAG: glycosyltransferase family 9 protein [Candidatus Omnitrophica bacterium]|nr:glycosyltransferase family 9 protein [Candidatus Omnitrophota bacterium]
MKKITSILFISLSNIGDAILTTPALMALVHQFPDARLTVVSGPRARGVFEQSRFVHKLIVYDKKKSLHDKLAFIFELRKQKYDLVIDLRNSAIPFMVSASKRSPVVRNFSQTNMRERHLEVLGMTGLDTGCHTGFDFFHEADRVSVLEKLSAAGVTLSNGWILIAPVAASGLKTWPLQGFSKVIENLLKNFPQTILIAGDHRERELSKSLVEMNPARIVQIGGMTSLRELAFLVSKAGLLLSNDSAVMHMGFELDVPVVAVFGPTNHHRYGHEGERFKIVRAGSPCSPCESPRCLYERRHCFEDLDAEKVYAACRNLLERQKACR